MGRSMNGLPGGAVTFLFTDIEGSTRLVKALRERYPQVLADHRRLIRAAIAAHDGHEVDTQGDAFFVAFAGAKHAVLCALTIQRAGTGRLYYRIGMTYAPASLQLAPADHGFVVERRYEAIDDPKDVTRAADGTWHIQAGARVRVRLSMVNDSRRYHVALVDPLPAGLEILNPALATTGPIPDDPKQASQRGPYWWWYGPWYEHQNLRDERAEAFTPLLRTGIFRRRPIWALAMTACTYSGVPKAGEPVRMSTLEVNAPITQGAPGRTSWHSVITPSASAVCWTSAPARVTGAMAPISVNGVMTTHWPCWARTMTHSRISSSTARARRSRRAASSAPPSPSSGNGSRAKA